MTSSLAERFQTLHEIVRTTRRCQESHSTSLPQALICEPARWISPFSGPRSESAAGREASAAGET